MRFFVGLLLLGTPALADPVPGVAVEPSPAAVKAAPRPFPFAQWNALLDKNVDTHGRVRYAEVDAHAVDALLAALDASSPKHDPGYNVAMWANVLRRPHLESVIDDKKAIFETPPFYFGGEALTLQQLEERVRKLGDPRVHMALNCASASCPELPRKAFTPAGLDAQLDQDTRHFCESVTYDAGTNTASLSKIFEWYKGDFGDVVAFVNRYRAQKIPAAAKLVYAEYDWRLNDQSLKR